MSKACASVNTYTSTSIYSTRGAPGLTRAGRSPSTPHGRPTLVAVRSHCPASERPRLCRSDPAKLAAGTVEHDMRRPGDPFEKNCSSHSRTQTHIRMGLLGLDFSQRGVESVGRGRVHLALRAGVRWRSDRAARSHVNSSPRIMDCCHQGTAVPLRLCLRRALLPASWPGA